MWLPKFPATLVDNSIDQHSLFIVQAWHELLNPTTPDSYQAKTLNLPLLLHDMRHVAHVATDDERWLSYLPMLADELSHVAHGEERLLLADPRLAFAIEDVKQTARARRDLPALLDKLDLALAFMGDPASRLIADAIQLAPAAGSGKKLQREALVARLSSLATHMQYNGCGDESFAMLDEALLAKTPAEVIAALTSPLQRSTCLWTCILAVSGKRSEVVSTATAADFRPGEARDFAGQGKDAQAWKRLYKDFPQIVVEVEARSARNAAIVAMSRLSAALDVHNLYVNAPTFLVFDKVLAFSVQDPAQIVRVTPSDHFGLRPRGEHRALAKGRIRNIGVRLDGRLANALESHRLAVSASDPRTAIINLWTAMEALCGHTGPASIGNRVATKIAPIIAWRRWDRIATHLALEIHTTRSFVNTWVDQRIFPRSKPYKMSADDVLSALTGPRSNPAVEGLFYMVGFSPLLRHRIHEAWKVFHEPAAVRRGLKTCKDRIEWQIYRIYRSRNLLVHRGESSHLNWRILQNAQYYVSTALGRVMHDMTAHPGWTVDTSLQHHAQHFGYLLDALEKKSVPLRHRDLLSDRSECPDLKVWP